MPYGTTGLTLRDTLPGAFDDGAIPEASFDDEDNSQYIALLFEDI
jgi:hypothetical protein